ncbi:MAG: DUF2780 domain-containing protein [Thermoanaerobaculia bacterium]
MKRTLFLAAVLVVAASTTLAQVPVTAPAAPAPAQAAAAPALTVENSANPELVGSLVSKLGVTPKQAEGGAGALLGLAKGKLKADDYAKVATAIPGTEKLIASAPAADAPKAGGALGAAAGAMGTQAAGLAGLAPVFGKLGLKSDMVAKFAPVVVDYAQKKGGDTVGKLLGGVLK